MVIVQSTLFFLDFPVSDLLFSTFQIYYVVFLYNLLTIVRVSKYIKELVRENCQLVHTVYDLSRFTNKTHALTHFISSISLNVPFSTCNCCWHFISFLVFFFLLHYFLEELLSIRLIALKILLGLQEPGYKDFKRNRSVH